MIKTMHIDDQNFDMIVTYARRAIRKYAPDWTDENAHDPGITLIELMAWLKEMLQFYMDQTTEPLEEQFLKLLGIEADFGKPATAVVQSIESEKRIVLNERTKLLKGRFIFETDAEQTLMPIHIADVLVDYDGERRSVLQNLKNGLSIYPFGQEIKEGVALYLVLDGPLDLSHAEQFYFKLYEGYRIKRNPIVDPKSYIPLAVLSWAVGESFETLKSVAIERDDTMGLIQSGLVVMASSAEVKGHIIQIKLTEAHYDYAPRILDVYNRVFEVTQRDTLSFETDKQLIYDGDGLPNQQFRMPHEDIYFETLMVEVLNGAGDQAQWELWSRVPRLMDAGEEEKCFYVNVEERLLCFGDGKHGKIPRKGARNIRIAKLERSYLEQGNIELDQLSTKDDQLKFKCLSKASGGQKYCHLDDLKDKLRDLMQEPSVCASAEDYERVLMNTQGLMLRSVKCLPMYRPNMLGYPDVLADNAVSLFVIPDGPNKLNKLNEAYLKNLVQQAEKHRPVTTKLYILDPSYYEIHVYCEVISKLDEMTAKRHGEEILMNADAYSLGEAVTKSGIYRQLRQSGVITQVKNINLSCSRFVTKNRLGDLMIPPDGMPVIASIEVVVISDH